jgi:poly(3-hydroxybutyrate) depolymerase
MPEHSSFIRRRSLALRLAIAIVGGALSLASSAEPPLPALNIDVTQTSISGISSGGFMTVQFQLAHSSIIVAGGPFNCSKADVFRAVANCSCTGEPAVPCAVTESSADVPALVAGAEDMARQGLIDATRNLDGQRIHTVYSVKDTQVTPANTHQI